MLALLANKEITIEALKRELADKKSAAEKQVQREGKLKGVYSSSGLITNEESWYSVRQAVQQDMLRPSSANYYIPHIETVAENFVQAVRSARDHQGKKH